MKGLHERKPNFGTAATKRWQCYRGQLKIIAEKVRKKTKKLEKTEIVLQYRKSSKILANLEIRTHAVFNEHKNFICLRFVRIGQPWMHTEGERAIKRQRGMKTTTR